MSRAKLVISLFLIVALSALGTIAYFLRAEMGTLSCCLEDPGLTLARAELGDIEAQLDLGIAYAEAGSDSTTLNAKAIKWLRKSAEGGLAAAQNEMGVIYQGGFYGVPVDHSEALTWFELGAAQGDSLAHFNLGRMYVEGFGVKRDDVKANHHLRESASGSYGPSLLELGYRTIEGVAMKPDREAGRQLIARAAASYGEKLLFEHRLGWLNDLTALHIILPKIEAKAARSGRDWPSLAFDAAQWILENEGKDPAEIGPLWPNDDGDVGALDQAWIPGFFRVFPAENDAGTSDEDGEVTAYIFAMGLISVSAGLGNRDAQYELGLFFHGGGDTPFDPENTRYWFMRAANQGHPEAQRALEEVR